MSTDTNAPFVHFDDVWLAYNDELLAQNGLYAKLYFGQRATESAIAGDD